MPHSGRRVLLPAARGVLLAGVALLSLSLVPVARADEFPPVDLPSLNGTDGFRLDGAAGDYAGRPVSQAGDVNGDGFDDVIIGAAEASPHGVKSGSSYVVFGRKGGFAAAIDLTALNGANGFRVDGKSPYDYSGLSVSAAGDVNGDGFADVIIGVHYEDPHGISSGSSYVVFGKAGGFAATLDLSRLNGSNGFRLDGAASGDLSGRSVSGAGDVNGDGFDDLLIGAPYANSHGIESGASYVVFGKAQGFAKSIDLSALNGSNGFRLDGAAAYDYSASSVSAAGDVNGDGFADILIGAPGADPHTINARSGSSYVVFGKRSGFAAAINLSSLDGNNGFRLDGADSDSTGRSVSGAGDVNGDGFADVAIGAPGANVSTGYYSNFTDGATYLVYGKAQGFAPVVELSDLNGNNGFRINGAFDDHSGSAVSAAGDINGDGFADVIIGCASFSDRGGVTPGRGVVVFGKAQGSAASVSLSGFSLHGANYDFIGRSISGAGDVNGDGFDDVMIGAPGAEPNGLYSGSSYVVFGRGPDSARTRAGSAADQYISGGKFADSLSGLDGNDELEGRGGGDVLQGGSDADMASYAHAPSKVTVDLASPGNNSGAAAGDSYDSIENLRGSESDDTLSGNDLRNVITGGKGSDTLQGRAGGDVFRYLKVSDSPKGLGRDTIADFNPGTATSTVDRISVSAIDANPRIGGNQRFKFIGTAEFSNKRGELRVQQSGADVVVSGDVDGNGVSDFEILLKNVSVNDLTAEDFRL